MSSLQQNGRDIPWGGESSPNLLMALLEHPDFDPLLQRPDGSLVCRWALQRVIFRLGRGASGFAPVFAKLLQVFADKNISPEPVIKSIGPILLNGTACSPLSRRFGWQ